MKKLSELKDYTDNLKVIDSMNDQERYQWYLRIKDSLPKLKKLFPTEEIETAISEYERRHGIV